MVTAGIVGKRAHIPLVEEGEGASVDVEEDGRALRPRLG
jgi:hypothetical protein